MLELSGAFTPNHEEVAAKVIDGELIIIRLSDGTYYSMDNVGARVWELIEGACGLPAIVETIAASFGAAAERVERDVEVLVRNLLAERLIVAAAGGPAAVPAEVTAANGVSYETPRLNVYRDMGNLLALDPPTPGIDELLFKDEKDR